LQTKLPEEELHEARHKILELQKSVDEAAVLRRDVAVLKEENKHLSEQLRSCRIELTRLAAQRAQQPVTRLSRSDWLKQQQR
jgi:hypothetical protein